MKTVAILFIWMIFENNSVPSTPYRITWIHRKHVLMSASCRVGLFWCRNLSQRTASHIIIVAVRLSLFGNSIKYTVVVVLAPNWFTVVILAYVGTETDPTLQCTGTPFGLNCALDVIYCKSSLCWSFAIFTSLRLMWVKLSAHLCCFLLFTLR